MRCLRLLSGFLLKSTGMRNNPYHYLNLGFQIKSQVLLNELYFIGKNEFLFSSSSTLNLA